jgi:hypothetical protein
MNDQTNDSPKKYLFEIISEMWDKDCIIDNTRLDDESTNIAMIHNKYLKIYFQVQNKQRQTKAKLNSKKLELTLYYKGELNIKETLERINRMPWSKTILKQDIDNYVETDEEYVDILHKVMYYEQVLKYLEEILKSINNRQFHISNAIKWRQLTQM